jgi:hypothetical protein
VQHKEIIVLHQYFQQKNLNPLTGSLERPVKELMDLNIRALQSISYFTPTELLNMRKPEEMMEKNLEVFLENSHQALTYMHNVLGLVERNLLKSVDTTLKGAKDLSHAIKTTATAVNTHSKSTAKKATKTFKTVAAKAAPRTTAKTTTSKTKAGATQLTASSTKNRTIKKQPLKHAGTTTNKGSLNTTTNKTTGINSGAKSVSANMPQHFSSGSSQMKPLIKDADAHANKTKN